MADMLTMARGGHKRLEAGNFPTHPSGKRAVDKNAPVGFRRCGFEATPPKLEGQDAMLPLSEWINAQPRR
jgi:hypothetical protein